MSTDTTVSWEEIFDEFPEDQKAIILKQAEIDYEHDGAMIKFRSIKEVVRNRLRATTSLSASAIREIEKNADFILATFRQAVEDEGGKFTMVMDVPNHISYNLFDLRDEYEDIEGTPLGPFYEEEDINEANNQVEVLREETIESGSDKRTKLAA